MAAPVTMPPAEEIERVLDIVLEVFRESGVRVSALAILRHGIEAGMGEAKALALAEALEARQKAAAQDREVA